ncbi:MAG: T9SS type A sorting domain-containing protein [Vicingaceae bacterium]|nr:T9SS type A sorting domain-containing protein [Vicingaceae bacterium]
MKKILQLFLLIILFLYSDLIFAAAPPYGNNNTCGTAVNANTASSGSTCTDYTLNGSNITGDPLSSCNTSTENTSTWYSVTATSPNMTFTGDNAATSGVSCRHSVTVYSGSCAGGLTEIGCAYDFNIVSVILTGLTVGQTYFVQISYSSGGSCANLDVCFYACETPSEDNCQGAQPIGPTPQSLDNFCTTPGPTTNTPTITPGNLCAGSLENTAWYTFTVQNTADVVITISNIVCTGGGAGFQIGYFTGTCGSLSNIGCQSGSGGTVTATITGLTAGQQVTIAIDGNAGAECTYDISATNTVPLPITLSHFDATYNPKTSAVELDWATSSEINNEFFTVEKSVDGVTFEVVGIVDGAGNSSELKSYNTLDKKPYIGTSYYRLKQTDFDGKFEYSDLVPVNVEDVISNPTIYPNPITNNGVLEFNTNSTEVTVVTIYDVSGRIVMSNQHLTNKGINKIQLETSELTNGMYFISLKNGNNKTNLKLIKE